MSDEPVQVFSEMEALQRRIRHALDHGAPIGDVEREIARTRSGDSEAERWRFLVYARHYQRARRRRHGGAAARTATR